LPLARIKKVMKTDQEVKVWNENFFTVIVTIWLTRVFIDD
jgi:hypothetical protein